ncbi:MAG TPA: hypothetical protein PLH57_07590, partial [Oligoflexia bacterium]|nr:hypothetical protein [Oligoflexia bacterium]
MTMASPEENNPRPRSAVLASIIVVAVFLTVLGSATARYWMELFKKTENPLCANEVVETIVELALQSDYAQLRKWMNETGPEKTKNCIGAVDGRFDRFGQARMELLKALASMRNEGISGPTRSEWGGALSFAARSILRP